MKICSKCGSENPDSDYRKNSRRCKKCIKQEKSEWWVEQKKIPGFMEARREKANSDHHKRKSDPEYLMLRHEWARDYKSKAKDEVLSAYGNKCACCGETRRQFLSVDHVGGGGNKHRQELNGKQIYTWLRMNGFPEGFQILCFNCNLARGFFGYCCNVPVIIPSIEGKEL